MSTGNAYLLHRERIFITINQYWTCFEKKVIQVIFCTNRIRTGADISPKILKRRSTNWAIKEDECLMQIYTTLTMYKESFIMRHISQNRSSVTIIRTCMFCLYKYQWLTVLISSNSSKGQLFGQYLQPVNVSIIY